MRTPDPRDGADARLIRSPAERAARVRRSLTRRASIRRGCRSRTAENPDESPVSLLHLGFRDRGGGGLLVRAGRSLEEQHDTVSIELARAFRVGDDTSK